MWPIPPQLSVGFPGFHSCFVILLEGEVCAGLISITVSSFPITPRTPAGCLFTFRNKKWACAREDVPLIRGEAPPFTPSPPPLSSPPPSRPPPNNPELHISEPPLHLLSSHNHSCSPVSYPISLSVLSPKTVFFPLPFAGSPTAPLLCRLSSCQITSNKTQANGP